ncbi:hypothetical protein Tco_0442172 [Tanacetum coccineum]
MRTKPGVDTLSFDDLYNNLRVFESDIRGSTASSSSSPQNVAFVSENTNSTNCCPQLVTMRTWEKRLLNMSLKEWIEGASGHLIFNENEKVLHEDRENYN